MKPRVKSSDIHEKKLRGLDGSNKIVSVRRFSCLFSLTRWEIVSFSKFPYSTLICRPLDSLPCSLVNSPISFAKIVDSWTHIIRLALIPAKRSTVRSFHSFRCFRFSSIGKYSCRSIDCWRKLVSTKNLPHLDFVLYHFRYSINTPFINQSIVVTMVYISVLQTHNTRKIVLICENPFCVTTILTWLNWHAWAKLFEIFSQAVTFTGIKGNRQHDSMQTATSPTFMLAKNKYQLEVIRNWRMAQKNKCCLHFIAF